MFKNKVKVEKVESDKWKLLENISYITSYERITVPAGFITDFASTPRLIWWLFPPFGNTYIKSTIIHDFLYKNKTKHTRREADAILFYAMKQEGSGLLKRTLFYLAVRLFGSKFYKR